MQVSLGHSIRYLQARHSVSMVQGGLHSADSEAEVGVSNGAVSMQKGHLVLIAENSRRCDLRTSPPSEASSGWCMKAGHPVVPSCSDRSVHHVRKSSTLLQHAGWVNRLMSGTIFREERNGAPIGGWPIVLVPSVLGICIRTA